MFEYSPEDWRKFTKTEQKLIVLVRKHGIEDENRLRMLLNWPLEPMDASTFRCHRSRIRNKVAKLRRVGLHKSLDSAGDDVDSPG